MMACLICGGAAQVWEYDRGGLSVDCVDCGRYDVTGSVMEIRAKNGFSFDVGQTKLWLDAQRLTGRHAPLIDTGTVKWSASQAE